MAEDEKQADAKAQDDKPASAPASTDHFREATERVRRRADLTAKAVGGLGTTAITALGIAKFADVFPFPGGEGLALAGLLGGFVGMAFVVVCFTARLWYVNSPIVLKTNVAEMDDLDAAEAAVVARLYQRIADLNGAPSLPAYEARAWRLQRIAERSGDHLSKKLDAKVKEIGHDIASVQNRAGMIIVRRRATHALANATAGALYAVFVVALMAFGIAADRLDSERPAKEKTPTAAEKRQQAIENLGTALGACEAAREKAAAADPCAAVFEKLASG